MPDLRDPDDKELGQPGVNTRSGRLRALIDGGQWSGDDSIVLIYWSSAREQWVMWRDPDPLG